MVVESKVSLIKTENYDVIKERCIHHYDYFDVTIASSLKCRDKYLFNDILQGSP